ncbi:MAG TPA: TIGR00730 family Rossman fold protein [Gemmataceae bacterium]|nr:TIGR00730 family Rossman fold protein [Gemmataceae bacterium]
MMKRVCVFCGSSRGANPAYSEAARTLGQLLAQRGLELVFGAGHIGLMGVLADAVVAAGGKTSGVIPRSMVERELAHTGLDHLHIVETMHERKALMADLADAFISLPGGFGTADELFEILTWAQLGIHQKPVGLINIAGFFDPLLAWLDRAVADGFLKPHHRRLLIEAATAEKVLDRLDQFHPAQPHGIDADAR